jgi:DNA-binding beta-propeller fold protein YncE
VTRAGALLLALTAAAEAPEVIVSVPEQHRLVEGIATDGKTIWLSSVLDRAILTRLDRKAGNFVMPAGTLHPMGLAWDAKRGWLWVATDCPDLPGVAKCESGALVALDRKGRLKARFTPGTGFHPGDVSAGANGEVFVSDSLNGAVYRLNDKMLDPVIVPGVGRSAQGTALTTDGKKLVVADYGRGVAVVDLATKVRTLLPMADGKPLRGIDGLVRVGGDYYTVHNGSSPGSLIRFRIDGATIDVAVVQRGAPLIDPTQLASDGKRLLVVADAGWPAASKAGTPPRGPGTVVAFDLR